MPLLSVARALKPRVTTRIHTHRSRATVCGPQYLWRRRVEGPGGVFVRAIEPEKEGDESPAESIEGDTTNITGASDASGEAGTGGVEKLSTEEIQRQMSELRRQKEELEGAGKGGEEGLVSGVMEEVGLIQWPSFVSALGNTVLVIVIVLGTSAVLFGVNTLLTEASGVIYGS